jgi:hypothetical protein
MADDVFGRAPSPFGGAFSADLSTMNFSAYPAASGALIQNLQVNYQQQVNQVFEIGSPYRYYVVGRTSGTLAFGRIVGPVATNKDILKKLGNICTSTEKDRTITLNLGSTQCGIAPVVPGAAAAPLILEANAVIATSVGFSVQAQDMLINENVQCTCGQVSIL